MEHPESNLLTLCKSIITSVEIIMSPDSCPYTRRRAQQVFDSLRTNRESFDMCKVGFTIISMSTSPHVIHTGLQTIYNAVRYHWSEMPEMKRQYVKEMLFSYLQTDSTLSHSVIFSTYHNQECFSKVIVEIAKKEWPQLWPQFLPEIIQMSDQSNIPFLILRRLIEDVVSLDTVESHERRADLMQALNLCATQLMDFLYKALKDSLEKCLMSNPIKEMERRVTLALNVISACFEWVNTSVILTEGRIGYLMSMLELKSFQIPALECLQQVMERKGTKKESEIPREFLKLESCENFVRNISRLEIVTEDDYQFLHKLGELYILIGSTLPPTYAAEVSNFSQCVTMLCSIGDVQTSGLGATAYNNLVKNVERLTEAKPDMTPLQHLITILLQKFVSPPNMTEKNHMVVLKQSLINLLRAATRLKKNFYLTVSQWYHDSLQNDIISSIHHLDVMAFVFEAVGSTSSSDCVDILESGLSDLKASLLRYNAEGDPTLKSSYLSVVSSLFVFLNFAKLQNKFGEAHRLLMETIFSSTFGVFLPGEIGEAQMALRNHAASLLIKLATKFPDLLSSCFNSLSNLARVSLPNMRHIEIQFTMECFFIISNSWNDYNRQKVLVENALQNEKWVEMEKMVESPEAFFGIFQEHVFLQQKSIVSNNLHMLHATLRRVRTLTVGPNQDRVHAAYEVSQAILPIVFQYAKMLYHVNQNLEFRGVMDLTESEKGQVLGIVHIPGTYPRPLGGGTQGQNEAGETHRSLVFKFIRTSMEVTYGILGLSCVLFSPSIYEIPQILDLLLNSVGWKLGTLPDFRIRNIVYSVYRPFIHCCPISCQDGVLMPFMRAFLPFMFQLLCQRWTQVQQGTLSNSEGDEETEVLETAILRLFTKEYFDMIYVVLEDCAQKKDYLKQLNGLMESSGGMDVEMKEDTDDQEGSTGEKQRATARLSNLGLNLLKDPVCFQTIVHLYGIALCWSDSGVNYRAARSLILCWDQISPNIDLVLSVLTNALGSISNTTKHEATKEILARLIDHIHKTTHKEDLRINKVILDWGGSEEDLKKLAGSAGEGAKNDKRRKDIIRRMVQSNSKLEWEAIQKTSWFHGMPRLVSQKERMNTDDTGLNERFSLVDTLMPRIS